MRGFDALVPTVRYIHWPADLEDSSQVSPAGVAHSLALTRAASEPNFLRSHMQVHSTIESVLDSFFVHMVLLKICQHQVICWTRGNCGVR